MQCDTTLSHICLSVTVDCTHDLPMDSLYSKFSKFCSKFCSKSSTHEGGHTVLGDEAERPKPSDPRAAAAQAAEHRQKLVKDFSNHKKP